MAAEGPKVAAAPHPLLWWISRGDARVYLFPTGEAPDDSWFTPSVRDAFGGSSELWLELGPPPPGERRDEIYEQLGHDSARTFLDALEPSVRTRATQYMEELAIPEDSVRTLRPWLAYYTFVTAFDKKYGHSEGFTDVKAEQLPPEFTLAGKAKREGKAIHYELTMEESLQRLAAMSDRQQSQYLRWTTSMTRSCLNTESRWRELRWNPSYSGPTQRFTASVVSAGVVLKQIRAPGASACTTLSISSNSSRLGGGCRRPAPIMTQSNRLACNALSTMRAAVAPRSTRQLTTS